MNTDAINLNSLDCTSKIETQFEVVDPLLITAAKDTIDHFQLQYLEGQTHQPCVETHKGIIAKLEEVKEVYELYASKLRSVAEQEHMLAQESSEFKHIMVMYGNRILDHVLEHKKTKAQVERLHHEIDEEILEVQRLQIKIDSIEELTARKQKLYDEIAECEEYEAFLLLCAEKHSGMMDRKDIEDLVDKYYSLKENHAEWLQNCQCTVDELTKRRIQWEAKKVELTTKIMQLQSDFSQLDDTDELRRKLADISDQILDSKLKCNTAERELQVLTFAIDNLYNYLPQNERTNKEKSLFNQLECVQQYCKDMEEILNVVARERRASVFDKLPEIKLQEEGVDRSIW